MYVWVLVVHANIMGATIDVFGDVFASKALCNEAIVFVQAHGEPFPSECVRTKVRTE
jgi:hypothetical protein